MILVPLAEASGKLAEASGKLAEASGKLAEASMARTAANLSWSADCEREIYIKIGFSRILIKSKSPMLSSKKSHDCLG